MASACHTPAPVAVEYAGSLQALMMQGQTQARVQPDTLVAQRPHLWGLGAATDLHGEWLIRDGEPHLSQVLGDSLHHSDGRGQTATLLVWSQVRAWEAGQVPPGLDQGALARWIADQAALHQLPVEGPFPLRLRGPVEQLHWHVIDLPDSLQGQSAGHAAHMRHAQRGSLQADTVDIFGFYSTQHQRVFTHQGASLHLHLFLDPGNAHVDALRTGQGLEILWPSRGGGKGGMRHAE